VSITYLYTNGVPNNLINAEYPINNIQKQGYLMITDTDTDNIYINIQHRMGNINLFGDFYISKVLTINNGNPNPNQYTVDLGTEISNIIYASIVSSEFPNIYNIVNNSNNKFYWQNIEDGNYIYSITIDNGNYTPQSLLTKMENIISNIPKINYNASLTNYINKNNIEFIYDKDTDIIKIKGYKIAILQQPFIIITPSISPIPVITDPVNVIIQIYHKNHGLNIGAEIIISNALTTMGISSDILNATHIINNILDTNNYTIEILNLNLSDTRQLTRGGNAVYIKVPNIMRIRADFADSVLSLFGFRKVGKETSISEYKSEIKNNEPYENETGSNITNNALNFYNPSYIYMICQQLGQSATNDNSISSIFSKIQLTNEYNKILYNTFVDKPEIYLDPIVSLYKLDISFVDNNNNLYDFNGLNHSFTLKVVTLTGHPKGTSMNTHNGKFT
jgi:hypothetical protein